MMDRRDRLFLATSIKLVIFCLVSIIVTTVLTVIMGRLGGEGKTEYHAMFNTASELEDGDDVRVAGVSVGAVTGVDITDDGKALVSFRIDNGVDLTPGSRAEVRYLNLVGARYLALKAGTPSAARLPAGVATRANIAWRSPVC